MEIDTQGIRQMTAKPYYTSSKHYKQTTPANRSAMRGGHLDKRCLFLLPPLVPGGGFTLAPAIPQRRGFCCLLHYFGVLLLQLLGGRGSLTPISLD